MLKISNSKLILVCGTRDLTLCLACLVVCGTRNLSLCPAPPLCPAVSLKGGDPMARKPRRKSNSGIYHSVIRGINRQIIFEDDEDKERLLETISRFKETCNYKLYGYCFMDNHIHLLIREVHEPISLTMKRISASYVYWYNNKYSRSGHLFQGRFKSETVETPRYFKTVLRYIHQNPLKANLVKNVFECQWTSLKEYLDRACIIDIDYAFDLFSPNRTKAIRQFTEY